MLQPPQLFGSLVVSTHLPLHEVPLLGHEHLPALQLVPPPHATPQPPQFALSVAGSMHD